jgi:hypothetical protein
VDHRTNVAPTEVVAAPAVGLSGKLGRVTSSGGFIPEIDELHFIAIASALAYHMNGDLLNEYNLIGLTRPL